MLILVQEFIWVTVLMLEKDYYLHKLKRNNGYFCGAFVIEVWWMIVPAKKLVPIIHVLGLKLVLEVRKNRVSEDLFAVCFAGMQHYVFSKICNAGWVFYSFKVLDILDVKHFYTKRSG